MKIEQRIWKKELGWMPQTAGALRKNAQLILVFGTPAALTNREIMQQIHTTYPSATLMGCSTAGEIVGTQVFDDSLVTTAIAFASTRIEGARIALNKTENAFTAGGISQP